MTAAFDPVKLLAQLTTEEKIKLLSGSDNWHSTGIERLNIPRVRTSDGPNGVRGTAWVGGPAASCTPCGTGLGASFNVDLAKRIGETLGEECRIRGVHCLLGPTTNIQRDPRGGRAFESFSEDPYHSGKIASAWLEGVHSKKVITTPKHYVSNEQEDYRRSNNSVVDERALHEIYLEPFRLQTQTKPLGFMTSYNRVNGVHAAEHVELLRILREDFGFGDGLVMSDWSGVYSTWEAVKAGLDLEMPGPSMMRGPCLERDIVSGKLQTEELDACVLRVLKFVKNAIDSGIPFEIEEKASETPGIKDLLCESAEQAVVLLKNKASVLPITAKKGLKVAVVGPHAKFAYYHGGGSASLRATYLVSPLEAVRNIVEKAGGSVSYALGADSSRWTPSLIPYLSLSNGEKRGDEVIRFDFYQNDPYPEGKKTQSKPDFTRYSGMHVNYFTDGIPKEIPVRGWIIGTTTLTPDESGIWQFGLGIAGQADMYLDGKRIIENSTNQKNTLLFFSSGSEERMAEVQLEKGRKYEIEIRFSNFKQLSAHAPYAGRRGGIRFGGQRKRDSAADINEAVALAKEADYTIVVVGNTSEWESEGYDRTDIKLPRNQNELVEAVLGAVADKAIICHQSGMSNELPWVEKASSLVQSFYSGNECGTGIANAVFGVSNPTGKLPFTWVKQLEDYPAHKDFGQLKDTKYSESIYVGYRYFDTKNNPRSLFPFGFGLSYTTYGYSDIQIASGKGANCVITFKLTNTGKVAGEEIAQIYVHAEGGAIDRPENELKAFKRIPLTPGQSELVEVKLDHTAFSYYDVGRHAWVAPAGHYKIRVGKSSTEICLETSFDLKSSFKWIGQQQPTAL